MNVRLLALLAALAAPAAEDVARRAAAGAGWHQVGLDPTPAPFDGFASIGGAIQAMRPLP